MLNFTIFWGGTVFMYDLLFFLLILVYATTVLFEYELAFLNAILILNNLQSLRKRSLKHLDLIFNLVSSIRSGIMKNNYSSGKVYHNKMMFCIIRDYFISSVSLGP